MTVALYPGSFDPIHNGHVEIVETASPGAMLDRAAFDQELSARAVDAGAELLLATRAVGWFMGWGTKALFPSRSCAWLERRNVCFI